MHKKVIVCFTAIFIAFGMHLKAEGGNCPNGSAGVLVSGPTRSHTPIKGGTTNPSWSQWQETDYAGPDGNFNVVVTSMRSRVVIRSYTCIDNDISVYACSDGSSYWHFDPKPTHSYTLPEDEKETQTVSWAPPYIAPDGKTWSVGISGISVSFSLVNIDIL